MEAMMDPKDLERLDDPEVIEWLFCEEHQKPWIPTTAQLDAWAAEDAAAAEAAKKDEAK